MVIFNAEDAKFTQSSVLLICEIREIRGKKATQTKINLRENPRDQFTGFQREPALPQLSRGTFLRRNSSSHR
jgi:hypothetical protein